MAAELVIVYFDKILQIVGLVRDNTKAKRELKSEALDAIIDALQCTERYVQERKGSAKRDENKEWSLSEKWRLASNRLSRIDKQLGAICWSKGGYWSSSDVWTDEMVEAKGIALREIDRKIQKLMGFDISD